jgi:hypothetical protein
MQYPPGITGVGYDTLLRVRDALESGEERETIREIVRQSESTDSERLTQIDLLIKELSARLRSLRLRQGQGTSRTTSQTMMHSNTCSSSN